MITVRRAEQRGHADHGWLLSYHTFSFADYYDAQYVSYGSLRVINEDRVAPGHGFGTHSHRDMEIVSYVLAGELEHRDSMGNGSVLRPGDVQRMSAGTGVTHSELNASKQHPLHFLQIWIIPSHAGIQPGYEERHYDEQEKRGRLLLIGTPDGREDTLHIHQDVDMYAGIFDGDDHATYALQRKRAYLHVALGSVEVNEQHLMAGDGAFIDDKDIRLERGQSAEVLLFDLA
ncbi:MAG TPA: pirin family protein [Burkholderiales bacterium]|nr:pirin family protein [Burkholderiales bacterium]